MCECSFCKVSASMKKIRDHLQSSGGSDLLVEADAIMEEIIDSSSKNDYYAHLLDKKNVECVICEFSTGLGVNSKRLGVAGNESEAEFAKLWVSKNTDGNEQSLLYTILGGKMSIRDQQVAATVIQWLGSPVGKAFIDQAQS